MCNKDLNIISDEKLTELKEILPHLGDDIGNNCAALTLTSILDVLSIDEFKLHYFINLAVPFSGFGAYNSKKRWKGSCGMGCGALAAIGIIIGGDEKSNKKNTIMHT